MTECINRRKRNAESIATRHTDPSYRILEQNADTNQRRLTRQTNDKDPRKSELLLGYLGLRTVYRITPPTLAHVIDICKWKERDEGRRPRNQKSTAKDKKREPKTKLQKKCGSKKEDLNKKTLSRNRPPASIQTD